MTKGRGHKVRFAAATMNLVPVCLPTQTATPNPAVYSHTHTQGHKQVVRGYQEVRHSLSSGQSGNDNGKTLKN